MSLFDSVNKLSDEDLMLLLKVEKCEPGKEVEIYLKGRKTMSRPEHISGVNTPEGIRRINEEQQSYDADPERYEREERRRQEDRELELEQERQERERQEQEE